ncbi:MAG: nitrate reductase subunit beta [Flavobacteriales bacterium]|nr:nitrate reductase subunit beta [Flavobacteriales bacterium]MBK6943185.1 nitrate reductase subunit beta [Flavobacteriales bacterium]MBK7240934.1 nitrate reductase subunit beta [Flavobacteriales bacterium]MBK7296462.1 nitrate reductase subunit beta [Flavobacteriales bacterium]MBK9536285.1 nitrate reductase subunit beta [Flavobacteriales bacterium]
MNVRSQITMVFHLDKCIGCHTCSIACKNIWTDRRGAEYMWWNNVETKPGTGYPTKWEDQDVYKGGWVKDGNSVSLRGAGKWKGLKNIFHNPNMPVLEDYYEPWTYKYSDLFTAPEGDDQPTARPVSLVTGEHIDVKSGPNWDDDLGGSQDYARKDVNFKDLSPVEQESMFQLERMMMFYLPRICNHCLNPACVGSCPSGALYKRGEDGIVLINQERCRAWRMCVTACPYKKSYYNWNTGKSEKCILCYPRLESGQAPACMHSCVGRIRYLGVMLYDADQIEAVASCPENELVDRQMAIYLDPNDPLVIAAAKANGIADSTIRSAQQSPVYKFVKEWGIALPLHPEYRTLPNLFYVPPMLPAMASVDSDGVYDSTTKSLWGGVETSRLPMKYLASLFTAGDEEKVRNVLRKLLAVKIHRRDATVGDLPKEEVEEAMQIGHTDPAQADAIFRLTSLATFNERFVIPPAHREESIEMIEATADVKGETGFGFKMKPARGL